LQGEERKQLTAGRKFLYAPRAASRGHRLHNQWFPPMVGASKLRQVSNAARQRIIKVLCSPAAWSEQKQREHRARSIGFLEAGTSP